MGQSISTFKDTIKDPEAKQKADDVLNAVMELAEKELELFYTRITSGNYDKKLIEIEKVLSKESYIYAVTTDKPVTVSETISQVGDLFNSGDTAKGVGKIIDKAFSTLMGSTTAASQKSEIYAITAGDLGDILRLDMMVFQYNFSNKALIENTVGVKACLVVKSAAQIDGLSENALRNIIAITYASSTKDVKKAILQEVLEAYETGKKRKEIK